MKISEKKHSELHNSIYDPIMDLRVKNTMDGFDKPELDQALFDLEKEIYSRVRVILNLTKD